MQRFFKSWCAFCALVVLTLSARSFALVGASPDTGQPGAATFHNIMGSGGGGSFQITEDVVLDSNAGPWTKNLVNSSGSGISSGADRTIFENLTNVGAAPWLDWHESILSRTTVNQPNDAPGFLFRQNSLIVMADYGGGFIPLTQNVDYTLVATPYLNGPAGDFGHWEAIDIFFASNRVIATGDVLKIEKDIFEIFGDGDPWRPGEAAEISEFPSPEPTSLFTAAATVGGCLLRRRQR